MLKVAICWSGLTKGLTNVVSFNKQLFDNISSITNDEIEFDHFCQFWNNNNKYLYDFDETLFDTQFKELDGVATENSDHVTDIIDILCPKSTVVDDFNTMGKKLLGTNFLKIHPIFLEYKTLAAQHGMVTHTTEYDINNTVDVREVWGYDVHLHYCHLVKHVAQFYAFEKVVSLAKVYDKDYDIIVRIRYDTVLAPSDIQNLITSMYNAKSDNAIIVSWFELPECVNNIHNTTFLSDTNINTAAETGKRWCIDDPFFIGSASCMYRLADNMFDNVYNYYCAGDDKNSLHAEHLWFNEIYTKRITCNASGNLMRYIIARNATDLDIFKQFYYNVARYRTEHRDKVEGTNHIIDSKSPSIIWSDPRRYVIPPNTYALASMLKLILQY
jgi:hypothetical protein